MIADCEETLSFGSSEHEFEKVLATDRSERVQYPQYESEEYAYNADVEVSQNGSEDGSSPPALHGGELSGVGVAPRIHVERDS